MYSYIVCIYIYIKYEIGIICMKCCSASAMYTFYRKLNSLHSTIFRIQNQFGRQ